MPQEKNCQSEMLEAGEQPDMGWEDGTDVVSCRVAKWAEWVLILGTVVKAGEER